MALVLFTKWSPLRKANVFLGLLILIFSVILFRGAAAEVEELKIPFKYQIILGLIWYLIPPSIYLHAVYTMYPDRKAKLVDGLHLIPLLLCVINILPFFLMLDAEQQVDWVASSRERNDLLYQITTNGTLLLIQYVVYIPLSFFMISKFLRERRHELVLESKRRMIFLRNAYLSLTLFIVLMESFRLLEIQGNWTTIFLVGVIATMSFLAYVTLYSPTNIFTGLRFHPKLGTQELTAEAAAYHHKVLLKRMADGAFRNPQLTLAELAEEIKLKPRQMTKLIKTRHDMSFSDFINAYRVNATKDMLTDSAYAHWTIMAIGSEVGFNSKTTFNRVFKQKTGLTPGQYQNQHQLSGTSDEVSGG
ncbi:MAG: helix-turn-helix transcriptional regulator [Bacteroidota bacterium]